MPTNSKDVKICNKKEGVLNVLYPITKASNCICEDGSTIEQSLDGKVDKVNGKGLSTNDFTIDEKIKLHFIEEDANKTTIVNTLTSESTTSALSAAQGKALNDNKADKYIGDPTDPNKWEVSNLTQNFDPYYYGDSNYTGIEYLNGKFVAFGKYGLIKTSTDGITWETSEINFKNIDRPGKYATIPHIHKIMWDGTNYIAATISGDFFKSTDGDSWDCFGATRNGDSYDLIYANGKYICVGYSPSIISSTDCTNWSTVSIGVSPYLYAITYGNGLFVTVGGSGKIYTSPDGTTWTSRTSGVSVGLNSVVYDNGLFVTVGERGKILTSPDGTTWTSRTSGTTNTFKRIRYLNNTFFAVGESGKILTSTDGITWNSRTSGTTETITGIAYNGTSYIAVGGHLASLTSTDGITWTANIPERLLFTVEETEDFTDIKYIKGKYIIVTRSGGVLMSNDGETWDITAENSYAPYITSSAYSGFFNSVTYGKNKYIVAGGIYSFGTTIAGDIFSSPDGTTWTRIMSDESTYFRSVTYGNGLFVVVGDNGKIYTSPDGTTWTFRTSGTTYDLHGIRYLNNTFFAVGGNGTILTSPDGTTWTSRTSGIAGTNPLRDVIYADGKYVAVGYECAATSTNGITWSARYGSALNNCNMFNLAYYGGVYVASGNYTLATSTTGLNWTSVPTPIVKCVDRVGTVIHVNGYFLVASYSAKIIRCRYIDLRDAIKMLLAGT